MPLSSHCVLLQIFQYMLESFQSLYHCVKSVRIRSFATLYLHIFGLDTERYGVSLRIHSESGKIRTRKTPNTETFHAVYIKVLLLVTFLVTISYYYLSQLRHTAFQIPFFKGYSLSFGCNVSFSNYIGLFQCNR